MTSSLGLRVFRWQAEDPPPNPEQCGQYYGGFCFECDLAAEAHPAATTEEGTWLTKREFDDLLWQCEQYKKAAEGWERECDILKAKYEPGVLELSDAAGKI
jgi:hypothetical protein